MATTRLHSVGHSKATYAQFNLGLYSGEKTTRVLANHAELSAGLPSAPLWLRQVHGKHVVNAQNHIADIEADGCIATTPSTVCAVLAADCIPVLLCDEKGACVAAVHAGWRGLDADIIQQAVTQMPVPPKALMAWMGPAISQRHYAVGEGFRDQFLAKTIDYSPVFIKREERWYADLFHIARLQLKAAGIINVYGGKYCTFSDEQRFYSHRRDGQTGRQACLIWIK